MPSYHSKIEASKSLGNLAFLTFKTKFRGPIYTVNQGDLTADGQMDIVDESLFYFKPNVFFKSYEVTSDSDRVLIYLTLYITECLKRLQKCSSKEAALQEMYSLAIARFDIPGIVFHSFSVTLSPEYFSNTGTIFNWVFSAWFI